MSVTIRHYSLQIIAECVALNAKFFHHFSTVDAFEVFESMFAFFFIFPYLDRPLDLASYFDVLLGRSQGETLLEVFLIVLDLLNYSLATR